jgi:ketosteroid isomerase-like protein
MMRILRARLAAVGEGDARRVGSCYTSNYEVWLPEDDGLLSRVYVRQAHVFWHEEIREPIG